MVFVEYILFLWYDEINKLRHRKFSQYFQLMFKNDRKKENNIMESEEGDTVIGKIAILLALSSDIEEEQMLKNKYAKEGFLCAITATGGEIQALVKKINNAVLGACLNNNIIDKTPEAVHAIIHATLEAKEGILMSSPSGASFVGKIAIVRKDNWIAIAIYGHSAAHILTNHERIGLGIMHL